MISRILFFFAALCLSVGAATPIVGYVPFMWPTHIGEDVNCYPAVAATSGTGNWGGAAIGASRSFVTYGQAWRIRATGYITSIRWYNPNDYTTPGSVSFQIWRKIAVHNWSLISDSGPINNLIDLKSAGWKKVNFINPLACAEGDFIGWSENDTGANAAYYLHALTSQTATTNYWCENSTPTSTGWDWEAQTVAAGVASSIEANMSAPSMVVIGDSIAAGHPANYSFLESTLTTDLTSTIAYQLSALSGATYQNMGVGSQTTATISARFTTDVVNHYPKIAIIEGGVNDIVGAVAIGTFQANWTSMLNACKTAGIRPVVLLILPWTNGTTGQMQTRDTWNAWLKSFALSNDPLANVVDASTYVGQFRAGGDAGNLWDIVPAYGDGSGVHFNSAGHGRIAQAIYDQCH